MVPGYLRLVVFNAGGLVPFVRSTEAERLRSCSVGWATSLLMEGRSSVSRSHKLCDFDLELEIRFCSPRYRFFLRVDSPGSFEDP